ncbi:tobamovirus multiplication protein 1 isoform X3 [Prunus dulcis]|uniref:tobamovirus multiplication protein 1 isoform X3 n=1 Tax=Prunus dulcis TaxID=3755 RepID=UPI00148312C8|nr:tobamovirus multiplication protein 1 isoform X3 [Prunus dulcis]
MMFLELLVEKSDCFPLDLLVFNIALAFFNGVLAVIAFSQLVRIHMRNRQSGWTRQKVLHLMIGSSNLGYFIYFTSTLVAACKKWFCWSNVCGFILMAYPKILFLAAFLLLLSFWVDLCHQANDDEEDDEDDSMQQALLENSKNKPNSSNKDGHRICCSFQSIHVGSHQKFVIAVVVLVLVLMMSFAVVIWIGVGKNPIDSSAVAQAYEDFLAFTVLLLGGALGCYGILLICKLRKVRSEKASSEMWKLYCQWSLKKTYGGKALVFLILYYFMGSLVPSTSVLWIVRELPPPIANHQREQSRTITFVSYAAVGTQRPRRWATVTSSNNQASRASPI